jgi:hypothetical protein
MKRSLPLLAVLACLLPAAAYPIGLEFRPSIGRATYQENIRDVGYVDSDWEALRGGFQAEVSELKAHWYAFVLEGAIWGTDEGEEEWNADSFRQTNNLKVWGWGGKALIGATLPIGEKALITPLVGVDYRRQSFSRSEFKVNYIPVDTETVTEKYPVFSAGGGLNAEVFLPQGFGLFGRVLYFDVIDSRAENSLLGDIDGDGGEIWSVEAGMEWTDNLSFALGAAVSYELQKLDGGTDDSGSLEWPENKLESIALVGAFRFFF